MSRVTGEVVSGRTDTGDTGETGLVTLTLVTGDADLLTLDLSVPTNEQL